MSEDTHEPEMTEEGLLPFVLDALETQTMDDILPILESSFPKYPPHDLFRAIILQQAWVHICADRIDEASMLIAELGESTTDHFREMWRKTTRNHVRASLYDYLNVLGLLSPQDQKNQEIIQTITAKYPNTSFARAKTACSGGILKIMEEASRFPMWQGIGDFVDDFDEDKWMVFKHLFQFPEEPVIQTANYFIGNIALIEKQTPEVINMLAGESKTVETLWLLHCQHKLPRMEEIFKAELDGKKDAKGLECMEFINTFYKELDEYERETLLDVMCKCGFFADEEMTDFEALLLRVCKSRLLFEVAWWAKTTLSIETFVRGLAKFCSERGLFVPFEMFIVCHQKARGVSSSDVDEPMMKFVLGMWKEKNMLQSSMTCLQSLANDKTDNMVELWKTLPADSLGPMGSFIWNKDPSKFSPGSPENEALAERMNGYYPLLASLVRGQIPEPVHNQVPRPDTQWRSPLFTSKNDLELHTLIDSQFSEDFSKVFTSYYGKIRGQPQFPHFNHPELVKTSSEPPYIHYLRSMLPISAFQQAMVDGLTEEDFKGLAKQCVEESLNNSASRLAALTFIQLADVKFGTEMTTDYKMVLALYDRIAVEGDATVIHDLCNVFAEKDQTSMRSVKEKIRPTCTEAFLISACAGHRCGLPLDYSCISCLAANSRPGELLLYCDRAAELGMEFDVDEIANIVKVRMPNGALKEHLLFHLTHILPDFMSETNEKPHPSLVVMKAMKRTDQLPFVSLLQEALCRQDRLYSLLATTIEGSDKLICALVTALTMTDACSFDVVSPPSRDEIVRMFLDTIGRLLLEGNVAEVIHMCGLFSTTSIVTHMCKWYQAVRNFTFKRAETETSYIDNVVNEKDTIDDDFVGEMSTSYFWDAFHVLQDALVKHCANKSQVHLFRYLQLLKSTTISLELKPRVEMAAVIEKYSDYRRTVTHCNLLGDFESIVCDLALHGSIDMAQSVAAKIKVSAAKATCEWLERQYKMASTITQVLEVHKKVAAVLSGGEPTFFVSLFAGLLPYAQPARLVDILRFGRSRITDESQCGLGKSLEALSLYIDICSELGIEVKEQNAERLTVSGALTILFPETNISRIIRNVPISIMAPTRYSAKALREFFNGSMERVMNVLLDRRRISDAKTVCEWRRENPRSIFMLEAVQNAIDGSGTSQDERNLLLSYGTVSDMEGLLEAVGKDYGWRFKLLGLHLKAARLLDLPTTNLLTEKTTTYLKAQLVISTVNWGLVRDLISVGSVRDSDVCDCLLDSFVNHVTGKLPVTLPNALDADDYGDNFRQFSELCKDKTAFGDGLLKKAKSVSITEPATVVNLILHASLCVADPSECARILDSMFESLSNNEEKDLISMIVSVFPEPTLVAKFFQYIITRVSLESMDPNIIEVGKVIMRGSQHAKSFDPSKYFELALRYDMYREYAELQLATGNLRFADSAARDATRHYLVALSYFLHVKCYSLAMECLKKLTLLSLQSSVREPSVLHLTKDEALTFMCTKDFAFALSVAVAYDMNNEADWACALFEQAVKKENEAFLRAFQCFRPMSAGLCRRVASLFKAAVVDEDDKARMKSFVMSVGNLIERYGLLCSLGFQEEIDIMRLNNPVVCEWHDKVLSRE